MWRASSLFHADPWSPWDTAPGQWAANRGQWRPCVDVTVLENEKEMKALVFFAEVTGLMKRKNLAFPSESEYGWFPVKFPLEEPENK